MPDHVVAHLVRVGKLDSDGISRRAHARRCPKCAAVVLVGLDHDTCAMQASVDPAPLTPIGEVEVLLGGRRTYDLEYTSRGYRIDPRFAEHIKRTPAGSTPGRDVVAEHQCGSRPPSSGHSRVRTAPGATQPLDTPPPF